jgi:hypothetical protein
MRSSRTLSAMAGVLELMRSAALQACGYFKHEAPCQRVFHARQRMRAAVVEQRDFVVVAANASCARLAMSRELCACACPPPGPARRGFQRESDVRRIRPRRYCCQYVDGRF